MNTKIYFNVNKVSRIELSFQKLSDKIFFPAKLGKRNYLLGFIPLWKNNDLPDRWAESDYYYTSDNEIRNNTWYRIQDEPKLLFYRPWVRVNMGYKEYILHYFDTDQEAQEFVDLILNTSNNTFEVIVS